MRAEGREWDVRLLAQEFLRRNAAANGREGISFSQDALKSLIAHSWPGNVREIENLVKRAVIMAEGKHLTAADLELESPSAASVSLNLKELREAVEREVINRALHKHSSKIAPAAAVVGVSRPTFYELMEKLGIAGSEREGKTTESA